MDCFLEHTDSTDSVFPSYGLLRIYMDSLAHGDLGDSRDFWHAVSADLGSFLCIFAGN